MKNWILYGWLAAGLMASGCGAGTIIASTLGGAAAVGSAYGAYEAVQHRKALQKALLKQNEAEEQGE